MELSDLNLEAPELRRFVPPEWKAMHDPDSEIVFFVHEKTNELRHAVPGLPFLKHEVHVYMDKDEEWVADEMDNPLRIAARETLTKRHLRQMKDSTPNPLGGDLGIDLPADDQQNFCQHHPHGHSHSHHGHHHQHHHHHHHHHRQNTDDSEYLEYPGESSLCLEFLRCFGRCCWLFCCPPCPPCIVRKIAFTPPPPTYILVENVNRPSTVNPATDVPIAPPGTNSTGATPNTDESKDSSKADEVISDKDPELVGGSTRPSQGSNDAQQLTPKTDETSVAPPVPEPTCFWQKSLQFRDEKFNCLLEQSIGLTPGMVECEFVRTRRGNRLACMYIYCASPPGPTPTRDAGQTARPPRRAARSAFTLLYSHGNAVDIGLMCGYYYEFARKLGCNLMAYDYSGYGASSGRPSEANLYADAEAVYKALLKRPEVRGNGKRVILLGQSIGSVPTVHLAHKYDVGGVILQSALLSGCKMMRPCANRNDICCDIFPNGKRLPFISSPVLVIHGTRDEIVPFAHGRTIFERCPNTVKPLWVKHGHHNGIEVHHSYFPRLRKFIYRELFEPGNAVGERRTDTSESGSVVTETLVQGGSTTPREDITGVREPVKSHGARHSKGSRGAKGTPHPRSGKSAKPGLQNVAEHNSRSPLMTAEEELAVNSHSSSEFHTARLPIGDSDLEDAEQDAIEYFVDYPGAKEIKGSANDHVYNGEDTSEMYSFRGPNQSLELLRVEPMADDGSDVRFTAAPPSSADLLPPSPSEQVDLAKLKQSTGDQSAEELQYVESASSTAALLPDKDADTESDTTSSPSSLRAVTTLKGPAAGDAGGSSGGGARPGSPVPHLIRKTPATVVQFFSGVIAASNTVGSGAVSIPQPVSSDESGTADARGERT